MARGSVVEESTGKLTLEELRAALRQVGTERYHHQHPFHVRMHEGKLSRGQLQAWALNRYARGESELWIMMATSSATAEFCAGSSWRKQLGWTGSGSCAQKGFCQRRDLSATNT
ncbi:MAG: hypothetical protein ABSD39_08755 [Terriglobales bacterium]